VDPKVAQQQSEQTLYGNDTQGICPGHGNRHVVHGHRGFIGAVVTRGKTNSMG
jgi:hypothetical protein